MNKTPEHILKQQVYQRLIALWVICEGFLGGIIHGLKIPVSGLVVGTCAVVCISLIARHVPGRGAILKATLIVAIFKLILSPHTPPMAYFSVFIQGLLGEIFFINRHYFKAACLALGLVSMTISALQRIFILLIVYGNDFWATVNDIAGKTFPILAKGNTSLWAAQIYLGIHIMMGIGAGYLAIRIDSRSSHWKLTGTTLIDHLDSEISGESNQKNARDSQKAIFRILAWIVFLCLTLFIGIQSGASRINIGKAGMIVLRTGLILLSWHLLINPVLSFLIRKWLDGKKAAQSKQVAAIFELLPGTRHLFLKSWELSKGLNGFSKIKNCVKLVVINTLYQTRGNE